MNKDELLYGLQKCLAQKNADKLCVVPRSILLACIAHIDNEETDETTLFLRIVRQHTTVTEFSILHELALAQGKAVPFDHLINVAGTTSRASLWVHMSRIRAKIITYSWGEIWLVRGIGYMWVYPRTQKPVNYQLIPDSIGKDDSVAPNQTSELSKLYLGSG